MKIGDVWHDIDDNKYIVTDVTQKQREDGSTIKNITSEKCEE